jgi:hypothetical protein
MAAYVRRSEADGSKWFYYQMEPSDLAVYAGHEFDKRVTLQWKGGLEVNRLASFFEQAASHVCGAWKYRSHVSFVTDDGLKEFDPNPGEIAPIPDWLTSQSGFVQFECLPTERASEGGAGHLPVVLVYANLDQEASSVDDLQQLIGIDLPRDALDSLEPEIARIIASTSSKFFPEGRNEELVRRNLKEVKSDLTLGFIPG